jgi:hypothetical protein
MRRFLDPSGEQWDAAIGRESWGTFVILFTPVAGGAARKAALQSESMLDAQQELDTLSEPDLRARLVASEPWQ